MEVAKVLELKGPSGTYSHCWMSRALQSFISTMPKMCCSAPPTAIGSPSAVARADDEAGLQLDVQLADAPKLGLSAFGGLVWPFGRRTGVPLTTTELARPLYPIGKCSQFGSSAFFGSRNIMPTLVACSFDE